MRYGRTNLRTLTVGALAAGVLTTSVSPALADGHQDAVRHRAAPVAIAAAAPAFECEYVGQKFARADRKAPIRTGMSSRAPVKAMVKKGQQVRYNYRCVSSKGTHWVKTTAPARGYLYIAHI